MKISSFLLILIGLIALDQIAKTIFTSIEIGINNYGIVLGGLKNADPFLRITIFSSLSAIIFFIYLIIQYVLVHKLFILRLGLTTLMSGIIGNAIDRAYYGFVRDFIPLPSNLYFNISDLYIDIGIILIVYSIFHHKDQIWYPQCVRNPFQIIKKSQIHFTNKVMAVVGGYATMVSIFTISFMNWMSFPNDFISKFFIGFIPLTFFYLLTTFAISIHLSKRIVGPLIALDRFVDELLTGKESDLALRNGDYFQELEAISKKIKKLKRGES